MKKKTLNLILGLLLIILAGAEMFYSIDNTDFSERSTGETIQLAHINWDTESASSNVLAIVLEEAGYNVNLVSVDEAVLFESIASGESDLTTSAWLPVSHGNFYENTKDSIDNMGANLEGTRAGLVVPEYMDVDSMEDLTDEADQTVTGVEPGSGTMGVTEEAMNAYDNLNDWTLESSSTGAMLGLLENAYANEEEIVVLGWTPHWKFITYDLKILEDPKGIYGGTEDIFTLSREGFKEDYPEAYEIADNFYWEIEDMDSVTLEMEQGVDDRTAAQNWVDDNRDKVDSWLEGAFDEE